MLGLFLCAKRLKSDDWLQAFATFLPRYLVLGNTGC
jgi:hypothetical protein